MLQGPPRRRRARPVADAPTDALLLRVEDLTKGWLLALLEQAPLDDAPAILAADVARDGPRLCAAIVRTLSDDEDLHRLESGGALEPLAAQAGAIAGARTPDAAALAVDALGAVIWSALRQELSDPDSDLISELSERLGLAMELVRAAVLRRVAVGVGPADPVRTEVPYRPGPAVPDATAEAAAPEAPAPEPPPGLHAVPPARREPGAGAHPGPEERAPGGGAGPEALWKEALNDEIARAERAGLQLSLLLAELEDAERLEATESSGEAAATFGRFAQAVRGAVRRHDILACETETRAWVIARDTGRIGAHALATRMVHAVRGTAPWRGAPLGVSVGFAVLGEDGHDVDSLIETAEEARYAAEASGIGVIPMHTPPFAPPEPGPDAPEPGLAG